MHRNSWPSPEIIFVLLATLGGIILIALIPPVGGGNERLNFQRAASVASGHVLVEPALLPGGIADFLNASKARFPEGATAPFSYSRADFEHLASIRLRAQRPSIVQPNPIAVLHPASYLPQIPVISLGVLLGLSPLVLFYLARVAGLAAGVTLTFFAIRITPIHKHGLAALAFLPPMLFSRSTFDADQFNNGLAFLFLALVMRETVAEGRIRVAALVGLSIGGFLLAQCKSAYIFLPLLALAIPAERFGSRRSKALAIAVIAIPGVLGSFAWMIALKQTYFHGLRYRTWSGVVLPDQQLQWVLSHPLIYAQIVGRTVFGTPLIPKSVIEFLGVFGPPVMMPTAFYPVLAILTGGAILSEGRAPRSPLQAWRARAVALSLALVTFLVILTLLYLQWTRFQAPVIEGFNGRYLYPLAPLLLMMVPSGGKALLGLPAPCWLLLVALVSLGGTVWITLTAYWV